MFSSLGNAFGAIKDRAIEACAKAIVNQEIGNFGEVTSLQVDSQQRTVAAQLSLKGESAPIEIRAGNYAILQENGQSFIAFRDFSASREWLAGALNQYVATRKFRVPDSLRAAL